MSFELDMSLMPRDPFAASAEFGRGMVSGAWTTERAGQELAAVLMTVLCDPNVVSDDYSVISEKFSDRPMNPRSELFAPMIRLAARGILLRDEDDEPLGPPTNIAIDQLVANTTEGITWVSPEGEKHREQLSGKTGGLLRSLMIGMHEGGYSRRRSKAIVRAEAEDMAEEVAARHTSYAAINFLFVNYMIMQKAGISNPAVFLRTLRRVTIGNRKVHKDS